MKYTVVQNVMDNLRSIGSGIFPELAPLVGLEKGRIRS